MKADAKVIEQQQIEQGMKKCPACAEMIKKEARVCRYCHREFSEDELNALLNKATIKAVQEVFCTSCGYKNNKIDDIRCRVCGRGLAAPL